MLHNLKKLLLFDNLIVNLPMELGSLYKLTVLGLEGNPLSHQLRGLLYKEGTRGVIFYFRDNCPVKDYHTEREFIQCSEPVNQNFEQATFSVLSYNILCEKYKHRHKCIHIPRLGHWLRDYRKNLIMQELFQREADIMCLQEVEPGQYEEFFSENLIGPEKYDGAFFPKSRAKTMNEWERRGVDGCAIVFKTSKFKLLDKMLIEFSQLALNRPEFKKSEDVYNRVMPKDNIAVVALLESVQAPYQRLLVANAHIHWDPNFCDVKMVQAALLMDEVTKLASEYGSSKWQTHSQGKMHNNQRSLPVLFCGDFNSTLKSGVVEYILNGHVDGSHQDFKDHQYGKYTEDGMDHKFELRSAYAYPEHAEFTNFTPSFKDAIDYIFYTSSTVSVTKVLGGLHGDYVDQTVGFPNSHFPSEYVEKRREFFCRVP